MVLGLELRCDLDGQRTYDRCVGICYLEGRDISEVMVRVDWHAIAPASAAVGMPAPSARQLPTAPPSAGPTPCPATAGRGDHGH
jgi:endonuclease YncB( thermonuclease family)